MVGLVLREVFRDNRDNKDWMGKGEVRRDENFSSAIKILGHHIDDWFSAGKSVSG